MTDRDQIEAAALAHLEELDADYEVLEIDPALADTEAFCEHYGYRLEESANCIIVASRGEQPTYAACLNLAHTRLDVNKRVRKLLGVRKLSFASAEQTTDLTGMMIGGVTPFGLPEDLPLYIDVRIRELERVIVGGGSRRLKYLVDPGVFDRMEAAQWVEGLATIPDRDS
ncbi:MAG: YbaK/EbsC family protein [Nitriliruptorales bacterium]|nr:YbaK/EbsC family protein [Nitriliruptorales bacterium]